MTYHAAVTAYKAELLRRALHEADGNRTKVARALGLDRTYLCKLLKDHGLSAPAPRAIADALRRSA